MLCNIPLQICLFRVKYHLIFILFFTNPGTCKIVIVIRYSPVIFFKYKFVPEGVFFVLYTGSESDLSTHGISWTRGGIRGKLIIYVSRVWSANQTETGSPLLLHELYGPSTLFSIAPSTSLSQRTEFLISFVVMGVIFWHPPPVALLSRDEAHSENRHGNLLCECKLRNALKIIHRSWVTKVHVHIVLCSHLSQYISLIPIM